MVVFWRSGLSGKPGGSLLLVGWFGARMRGW